MYCNIYMDMYCGLYFCFCKYWNNQEWVVYELTGLHWCKHYLYRHKYIIVWTVWIISFLASLTYI